MAIDYIKLSLDSLAYQVKSASKKHIEYLGFEIKDSNQSTIGISSGKNQMNHLCNFQSIVYIYFYVNQ